jgi:predicted phage terminase large subunit-like protein
MPPELVAVLDRPLEGFEMLPLLRKLPGGDLAPLLPPGERVNPLAVRFLDRDPRTEEGESMDPIRMPKSVLDGERRRWSKSGSYAGQMLQRPVLAEGDMVQRSWWGFCRLAGGVRDVFDGLDNDRPRPDLCLNREESPAQIIHAKHHGIHEWDLDWIGISCDPAAKKTTRGSLYGLLVVAGKGGRRYVLDDRSQRGAFHEILEVIVEMIHFWKPDFLLIEPKAAGPDIMDTLYERMGAGDVPVISIEECEPGASDKESRLEAALPYIRNGLVHLLDGAPWLKDFVDELSAFPRGKTDDRTDALSQVLNHKRVADDAWPSY